MVCLPAGGWYDFFTARRYEGGQVLKMQMPLDRIPVFVREGAILAEGPVVQHTGELHAKNRIERVRIFGMPDRGALNHEADLTLICSHGRASIYGIGRISLEAFDVELNEEEGVVEVIPKSG
jgi:alpha-D-xyloside xylohydrolase